jgi:hypothetical protein
MVEYQPWGLPVRQEKEFGFTRSATVTFRRALDEWVLVCPEKPAMASWNILRGSDRGHAGFLKDVDGRTDETYTPEIPALGRGRAALPVVTGVVRAQTYSTRPVRWTGGRMELACAKRLPQILSTATA